MSFSRVRRTCLCLAGIAAATLAAGAAPVEVQVERVGGDSIAGRLEAVDRDTVRLVVDGESRSLPVGDVRRIERIGPPAAAAPRPLALELVDGSWLEGDDLRWNPETAAVLRGDEAIEVPVDRLRSAAWRRAGAAGAAWRDAVPAEPMADLVAVSQEDGFELVECAIAAVAADVVTVVLDGDRIPVKRGKVLGLVWVRPATTAACRTPPSITTRLPVAVVAWTPDGLVLDDGMRMPADALRGIDYAVGRRVSLAELAPEKVVAEPFFAALGSVEGLASYFAPRTVPALERGGAGDAGRSLVMRPRTVATWRIPPGSRRFHGNVTRVATGRSAAVQVTVQADDAAPWRQALDAERGAQVIDVDVSSARRLRVEVDFAGGGMGCPVRLDAAAFEK